MDRIEVLEHSILGFSGGAVSRMTFGSPTVTELRELAALEQVEPIASDGRSVLAFTWSSSGNGLIVIAGDGTVTTVGPHAVEAFRSSFGQVALRQGQLVATIGQGIALLELSNDMGRMFTEGRLIAANDEVVVRLYCETDLICRYHTLGYDGQERWVIDAPPQVGFYDSQNRLSVDGRGLTRLGFEATAPLLEYINLQTGELWRITGEAVQVGPRTPPDLTADGGWYVLLTERDQIKLVPVSGALGGRVNLDLVSGVEAFAIRP